MHYSASKVRIWLSPCFLLFIFYISWHNIFIDPQNKQANMMTFNKLYYFSLQRKYSKPEYAIMISVLETFLIPISVYSAHPWKASYLRSSDLWYTSCCRVPLSGRCVALSQPSWWLVTSALDLCKSIRVSNGKMFFSAPLLHSKWSPVTMTLAQEKRIFLFYVHKSNIGELIIGRLWIVVLKREILDQRHNKVKENWIFYFDRN